MFLFDFMKESNTDFHIEKLQYRNKKIPNKIEKISSSHCEHSYVSYEDNGRIHKHYFNGLKEQGTLSNFDLIEKT